MEKSEFKQLKEQLLSHRKNGYDRMPETEPPSTSGASGEGAASEAISRHGRCARTSASSSGCSSYSSAG